MNHDDGASAGELFYDTTFSRYFQALLYLYRKLDKIYK